MNQRIQSHALSIPIAWRYDGYMGHLAETYYGKRDKILKVLDGNPDNVFLDSSIHIASSWLVVRTAQIYKRTGNVEEK